MISWALYWFHVFKPSQTSAFAHQHKSNRFAVEQKPIILSCRQYYALLDFILTDWVSVRHPDSPHISHTSCCNWLEYVLAPSRSYCFAYWKRFATWLRLATNPNCYLLLCLIWVCMCACVRCVCNLIAISSVSHRRNNSSVHNCRHYDARFAIFLLHCFLTICLRLHVSIH